MGVNVGNPDLKPRRSTNFDLAADWKLSGRYGGIVSVALFDKRIADEIFNAGSTGFTYEGMRYVNAVVTQPQNALSAGIRGVELNAIVNSLGFISPILSGLGVSGNVALLDGHFDERRSISVRPTP